MRAGGSSEPVGLLGLHSQTIDAVRAAARTAGTSSVHPSAGPRRGTDTIAPPRCSVTTRYIA